MLLHREAIDYCRATASYNELPPLEQQVTNITISTLEELGEIFVRHRVQDDFRLFLLHRHSALPDDNILVHFRQSLDEDTCAAQKVGANNTEPCAFAYDRERTEYHPIEFEYARRSYGYPQAGSRFLVEVGEYLESSGMDKILGLSYAPLATGCWIEHLMADGSGTVARRSVGDGDDKAGIITAWAFAADNGRVTTVPEMVCKQTRVGVHAKVPAPPK